MEESKKISRRAFLGRSLTGMAALGFVPFVDLWAQERESVAEWAPNASLYRFHLIGHGHIDPVWLWSWREGLSVVMSTFQASLDRMDENPEFKFTSSSALFYRWVAENDPEMFRKIRKRIDEGRWDVVGGWWIEPDVNLPGGEALVRQGLYGQLEFERLTGRRARTGFLPDSFGHSNSLPQILRQQGMDRYVFMRPMAHEKNMPADLFWWEGPDGSRLLAYRIQIGYSNAKDIRVRLERIINEFGQQPTKNYMAFYGAGDHGGGPTKKNFKQIAEIREQAGAPALIYSTPDRYFDEIEREAGLNLPVVKENLRNHAVGCYSVESAMKKGNRQAETALIAAEKIAAVGRMAWRATYPKAELTKAWEKVLFLQFHDSLAGTSQLEHSEVARHGYGYAMEAADQAIAMALQKLEWQIASEDPESEYLVVFNPHAWAKEFDIEYDLNIEGHVRPLDERGNPLPYQWTVGSSQTESVRKLLFRCALPAMGYRQIRVVKEENPQEILTDLIVSERTLENRYIRVSFSHNGAVGILDKETGRQVFAGGEAGCRALVLHDKSDTWSHGVLAYDDDFGEFGDARFKVLENGPLRGMVRVTTSHGQSMLAIDWMLHADARALEARVTLDWHEREKLLKFSFPVDVENAVVTCEAAYAYTEPERQGQEEPGHRWIDMSGARQGQACGLSVINDAKYGYSVHGNDMRMTVVRSPIFAHHAPNRLDPEKEYAWMDQGIQTFRMKILPHAGDWRRADLPRMAEEFSVPPISTYQGIHDGTLPKSGSFLEMDGSGVIVTSIKQSEKGDDLIVRCVETFGKSAPATLHLRWMGKTWEGDFSPFEIKSLRVDKSGQVKVVNLLEE